MSSQIKVLLLDAGGVLIKLNWDNFYKTLRIPKVINGVDLKNWLDKHSLHNDLEKGLISFEVFFEDFQNKFHLPITIDEFKKAWNSVLDGTHKGLGLCIKRGCTVAVQGGRLGEERGGAHKRTPTRAQGRQEPNQGWRHNPVTKDLGTLPLIFDQGA